MKNSFETLTYRKNAQKIKILLKSQRMKRISCLENNVLKHKEKNSIYIVNTRFFFSREYYNRSILKKKLLP